MPVRARRRPPPQGMAPEAVTDARARTTQATRKGWPYYIRSCRPPARGGPTLHDAFVPLVEGAYIVGPPLAGGLPAAASGPARRCVVACSLRGGLLLSWLPSPCWLPAPCWWPAPCVVACPPPRRGLPAAASGPASRSHGLQLTLLGSSSCGWPCNSTSSFFEWRHWQFAEECGL